MRESGAKRIRKTPEQQARTAEWKRQIGELKALGRQQVIAMHRAYFGATHIGHASTVFLAGRIVHENLTNI